MLEYYLAIKINEMRIHATWQMSLESTLRSERRRTRGTARRMFRFSEASGVGGCMGGRKEAGDRQVRGRMGGGCVVGVGLPSRGAKAFWN